MNHSCNLPWGALNTQVTGLQSRLEFVSENVFAPNLVPSLEIGPNLLITGGSNGINSSSVNIESDLIIKNKKVYFTLSTNYIKPKHEVTNYLKSIGLAPDIELACGSIKGECITLLEFQTE